MTGEQDQVARGSRDANLVQVHLRPLDRPGLGVGELDPRSRGLEVVEVLGVDRGELACSERVTDEADGR